LHGLDGSGQAVDRAGVPATHSRSAARDLVFRPTSARPKPGGPG
jgi:hypothetical protein